MKLTFGCDPEFFLFDRYQGKYVSAHSYLPGTKHEPYRLSEGAVQVDGTAGEFNIDATDDPKTFSNRIEGTLQEIRKMVPQHLEFKFVPAIRYDTKEWNSIPKKQKELGCDPDYNAFAEGEQNPPPLANTTLRTGGGHLHVGWTKDADIDDKWHRKDCCALIRHLNFSYNHFRKYWDDDMKRNSMYGRNAAFRPKTYGVEFRSPSNVWVNYPALHSWMLQMTQTLYDQLEAGSKFDKYGNARSDLSNPVHYFRYYYGFDVPALPALDKKLF